MEKKCVNLADIDSGVSCADFDNLAGVVKRIQYGYWDEVEMWPSLPEGTSASPLTLAAAGKWDGDLVLKIGAEVHTLEFTDGTGVLTMTDQGERGGESVLYQLDLVRSKVTDVILGFMNATRGRKMYFVVTDKNGVKYLMGDRLVGARRVAGDAVTTGTASTDRNGVPLRFTYECPRNLVFEGDFVTDDFTVLNDFPCEVTQRGGLSIRYNRPYEFTRLLEASKAFSFSVEGKGTFKFVRSTGSGANTILLFAVDSSLSSGGLNALLRDGLLLFTSAGETCVVTGIVTHPEFGG